MIDGFKFTNYSDFVKFGKKGHTFFLNQFHQINFYCSRVESHKMQQSICVTENQLFKIGQHPSIAEISQPELKKYRAVLSKEKYSELNRGIGLITHGVGIGSFVYLRRIFEYLIEEAHIELGTTDGWDEEEYLKARMADKIDLLQVELPEFLVENKALYGIMSIGIHELTEDNCKEYFPSIKLGIELILDEKLELKRKKDKIKNANKSIQKINQTIKEEKKGG
jgi:hypothetical protein